MKIQKSVNQSTLKKRNTTFRLWIVFSVHRAQLRLLSPQFSASSNTCGHLDQFSISRFHPKREKRDGMFVSCLLSSSRHPQPRDEREGCASCSCFLCGPGPHSASSSSLQAPDGRRNILSAPWRPVCFMTKSLAHAPPRS